MRTFFHHHILFLSEINNYKFLVIYYKHRCLLISHFSIFTSRRTFFAAKEKKSFSFSKFLKISHRFKTTWSDFSCFSILCSIAWKHTCFTLFWLLKETVFFTLDTGYYLNWHFIFMISYICIFRLNHLHFKFFMCIPEELQAFLKVVINSFYNSLLVKNLYLFNVGYLIFQ